MKIIKLISLILILLNTITLTNAIVSVTNSCFNNNIIFRLSDSNDAHASAYDYEEYDYYVCSNENLNGNPHVCDGKNTVLKLLSANNEHAAAPNNNDYGYSLC